jgi:N-acyl homoserine lactone hydrolase
MKIGGVVKVGDVRRVDFGYFVRPAEEAGAGQPRVEPVLGYLVRQSDRWLLFDTGMGVGPPELDAHYRPVRRPLAAALHGCGIGLEDVGLVVNCHLHFDHCGGNPELAGRPVFVQAGELAEARSVDGYTLAHLVDFPHAQYEELRGEAEIRPGVWVIPTPGHTLGHQSLVIRCADGTVILAGQAHDSATQFTSDHLAWRARRDEVAEPLPAASPWIDRLLRFDPARVLFAHDLAVWEPAQQR